jgi:cytochrome b6-f complex iron-sulfur subunit
MAPSDKTETNAGVPETPVELVPSSLAETSIARRKFLGGLWTGGAVLIGGAGIWTSWDFIRPLPTTGFGGVVRAVSPDAVTEDSVIEVPAARAFLTRVEGEVIALSQKCTHLGCRVPYCPSTGRFECPCHGSVFNRGGDFLAGPAPRGMDRYPVEVGDDGLLRIDTGETELGHEPGVFTVDDDGSDGRGIGCAAEEH